jgi:hypothetical protein
MLQFLSATETVTVAPLLRHQMILHINIEDVALTRAFVEAGRMLDVDLLDHLIVSSNRYVSLKAKGLGFA